MRRPSSADRPPQGGDAKTAELTAVRLLTRREHSQEELRRKLLSKGYPATVVDPVVEKLAGRRLVSDDRYIANFVHDHARRGQGPVRIRAELCRQGIEESRIEQEFERGEVDWARRAAEVRRRKFGASPPKSLSERAKQARFLQYRGFDADQIRAALSSDPSASCDAEASDLHLIDVDEGQDPDARSV